MAITDCVLNTSFPLDCKNSRGGIKKIAFAAFADNTSVGEAQGPSNSSGIVTAWTALNGKFYVYAVRSSIATGSNKITSNKANGTTFSAQALSTQLEKMSADKFQELKKMAGIRVYALITDRNNKVWLMGGHNGLDLTEAGGEFGTAMGDFNGIKLVLAGEEEEAMYEVNSSIVAALYT